MNAILQCFIHTPLIKTYFISGLFKNNISRSLMNQKGETLSKYLANFVEEYNTLNDPIVSLRKLRTNIGKFLSQFQGYDQHDAQEFLSMLLDRLTEELTVSVVFNLAKTAPSEGFNTLNLTKTGNNITSANQEKKISVIEDLFAGTLVNRISCPICKTINEKEEKFYYLSISLPQEVLSNSIT